MAEKNEPPWLQEAAALAYSTWTRTPGSNWSAVVRAVLAFADKQPRPITDAMIEAARQVLNEEMPVGWCLSYGILRAALEAVERAR